MNNIRNTTNNTLAMVAAMPATPQNPNTAAITATIRNINAQDKNPITNINHEKI